MKPINYSSNFEIEIDELAYGMDHEQAEFAITEIDRVICDLEFTETMARKFMQMALREGDNETNDSLIYFMKDIIKEYE